MKIRMKLRKLALAFILLWAPLFSAHAADTSSILLTISGKDLTTQELDFETLSAMASTKFETTTIWTDGPQSFEGVPLKTLLSSVGITQGSILATAVNDYAIEIPVSEISDTAPIVAYRQNGQRLKLREKGPLWLVYPYDRAAEYQTEVIYSRSIWQLDRLDVKSQ